MSIVDWVNFLGSFKPKKNFRRNLAHFETSFAEKFSWFSKHKTFTFMLAVIPIFSSNLLITSETYIHSDSEV